MLLLRSARRLSEKGVDLRDINANLQAASCLQTSLETIAVSAGNSTAGGQFVWVSLKRTIEQARPGKQEDSIVLLLVLFSFQLAQYYEY